MTSSRDAELADFVGTREASLRRLAILLCQDWHRADDLVQAAITKLYLHWPKARAADSIDAYVRAIVVREFLDERRSSWARRVRLTSHLPDRPAARTDPESAPGWGDNPASSAGAIPREFDTTQVYAEFGWLPARTHLASGSSTPPEQTLATAGPHVNEPSKEWNLTVQARGTCDVQRFPGSLFSLICLPGGRTDAADRAPDVNGHRAFWTGNRTALIWEYGINAWAILGQSMPMRAATGLRIAAGVKFGQHAPIKFASRLTAGHWQVVAVYFQPEHGVNLATEYDVANNGAVSKAARDAGSPGIGQIMTVPQRSGEYCNIPKSKQLTIHGYKFTLAVIKGTAWRVLCGPNEDGLFVRIYENGSHQPVTPTGIMYRMQLLGTKKADWVTSPLA